MTRVSKHNRCSLEICYVYLLHTVDANTETPNAEESRKPIMSSILMKAIV